MPAKLTFYHNPKSRAAMVHWMLEEVGAEYETRVLSFEAGDHKKPEFLAINPMGKLPTLVADDTVITETPAIIAWLADTYPEAGLAPPAGSVERGTYYRWLFFGGSVFEPALIDEMFHRPPPDHPGAAGWVSYDAVIDVLEQAIAHGPYLLGERFSAADVYIGSELYWATMFGAPRVKDSRPIIEYLARLDRPGRRRSFAPAPAPADAGA